MARVSARHCDAVVADELNRRADEDYAHREEVLAWDTEAPEAERGFLDEREWRDAMETYYLGLYPEAVFEEPEFGKPHGWSLAAVRAEFGGQGLGRQADDDRDTDWSRVWSLSFPTRLVWWNCGADEDDWRADDYRLRWDEMCLLGFGWKRQSHNPDLDLDDDLGPEPDVLPADVHEEPDPHSDLWCADVSDDFDAPWPDRPRKAKGFRGKGEDWKSNTRASRQWGRRLAPADCVAKQYRAPSDRSRLFDNDVEEAALLAERDLLADEIRLAEAIETVGAFPAEMVRMVVRQTAELLLFLESDDLVLVKDPSAETRFQRELREEMSEF